MNSTSGVILSRLSLSTISNHLWECLLLLRSKYKIPLIARLLWRLSTQTRNSSPWRPILSNSDHLRLERLKLSTFQLVWIMLRAPVSGSLLNKSVIGNLNLAVWVYLQFLSLPTLSSTDWWKNTLILSSSATHSSTILQWESKCYTTAELMKRSSGFSTLQSINSTLSHSPHSKYLFSFIPNACKMYECKILVMISEKIFWTFPIKGIT